MFVVVVKNFLRWSCVSFRELLFIGYYYVYNIILDNEKVFIRYRLSFLL